MSDEQPIDLDDLRRVAALVREKTADNWLADMVDLAAAEIERLREERPKVRVPLADLSGRVSRDRVIDALKDAGVEVEE